MNTLPTLEIMDLLKGCAWQLAVFSEKSDNAPIYPQGAQRSPTSVW